MNVLADVPSDIGELAEQEQNSERMTESPAPNWHRYALYAGIGIGVIAVAYIIYRAIAHPAGGNVSAPSSDTTTTGGSGGSVQGDNGGTASAGGSTAGGSVDTSAIGSAIQQLGQQQQTAFSTFAQQQQAGLAQIAQADQAAIAQQGQQTQADIANVQSQLTSESQALASLQSQQTQMEQTAQAQATAPAAPAAPIAPSVDKQASVTSYGPPASPGALAAAMQSSSFAAVAAQVDPTTAAVMAGESNTPLTASQVASAEKASNATLTPWQQAYLETGGASGVPAIPGGPGPQVMKNGQWVPQ